MFQPLRGHARLSSETDTICIGSGRFLVRSSVV